MASKYLYLTCIAFHLFGIRAELTVSGENDIRFFLYTNENPSGPTELFLDDTNTLDESGFMKGETLKVLTHGYRSNASGIFPLNVIDAYFNESDGTIPRNIIAVDWSSISTPKPGLDEFNPLNLVAIYTNAVKSVPKVGAEVAKLISYFIDKEMVPIESVHLIGHGLGAHVSGAAANSIFEKYGTKVKRITGLDPAGPSFYTNVFGRPLTKKDGEFVDVIHTDQGALGQAGQIGHVDFFPNGGTLAQYECRADEQYSEVLNPFTNLLSLGIYCSHSESHRLFAISIGRTDIKGCKTDLFFGDIYYCSPGTSEAIFGDNCPPESENGNYYLDFGEYL